MAGDSLFDAAEQEAAARVAPLAVRMRPRTLDEVVGQQHLLGPGAPLRRLVEGDAPLSVVLWGPPGTGKTTLAHGHRRQHPAPFRELSAVTAGVKDVRPVIDEAKRALGESGAQTVLFVDEVHRFSKTQQDALLPSVENRWVTLVAATTENPFFSVISPLLSRSPAAHPRAAHRRRRAHRRAPRARRRAGARRPGASSTPDAEDHLVRLAGGDARRALTALEAAARRGRRRADQPATLLEQAVDRAAVRYDRDGDQHYDVISAFIKSIRGSDVDAALHYLARMIEAGEDPRFIARRLVVHASEDVGMADPTALQVAVAAAQALDLIGMPEARLNLAQATIHLALAPKSNAVIAGVESALADVRAGRTGTVPPHLRDSHYAGAKTARPRQPRRSGPGRRATGTLTTSPDGSWRSSTHPTRSSGGSTTRRAVSGSSVSPRRTARGAARGPARRPRRRARGRRGRLPPPVPARHRPRPRSSLPSGQSKE